MNAFTLLYGIVALAVLIAVTVAAFFLRGWKAALIAAGITIVGLAAVLIGLIALITWNM